MWPLLLFVLLTVRSTLSDHQFAYVQTENGPLRGVKRSHFYAFEGIRYAKPPVGDLRLAAPVPYDDRWEEPRNATQPGPNCLQWTHLVENEEERMLGSEDCLFLNVYTPILDEGSTEPLPTVVHIHGGAFMFGSGDFSQPDHLVERPLIVVTLNYRVGPFGFLSTEDDVIPGNFGLKDQVVALKWVSRNIGGFGGSAELVTLAGCSAGSASVHLHYLSPLSKGLFRNGIGHSGSALNPWVMAENSAQKAREVATAVGCPTTSNTEMLECLRSKPAEDIVRTVGLFLDYLYNPFTPIGVVVEKETPNNPKPFLPEHPYKLMEAGQYHQVPLILSANEAEGLYPGAEFISKSEYLQDIDANWNRLLPSILDYQTSLRNDATRRDEISQKIRDRYLGKRSLNADTFLDFVKIISNRLYLTGIVTTAKLMSAHSPVHFYLDAYKTQYGISELLSGNRENYGVAHGEDSLLVFKSFLRELVPYSEEELLVAGQFVGMYEDMARDGVARFAGQEIPRVEEGAALKYLEVNYPKSVVKSVSEISDEEFWTRLDFGDGMPVAREGDLGKDEL